jgi:hypothetical protein
VPYQGHIYPENYPKYAVADYLHSGPRMGVAPRGTGVEPARGHTANLLGGVSADPHP